MADNSVILENSSEVVENEGDAAVAVTPGELIERRAGGEVGPHATSLGAAAPTWADVPIDPAKDKADDYAAGERVRYFHAPPGVAVDAIAGGAISENDFLISNGDGTLITYVAATADHDPGDIVGQAEEAAGAAGDRVKVRVM